MTKKVIDETKIKKDCYFYKKEKDLEGFRTQACKGCGALEEFVCGYKECDFYKTIEQETEAQSKYPFDRNYKITLAMKQFERDIAEKEKQQKAEKNDEELPNTLQ